MNKPVFVCIFAGAPGYVPQFNSMDNQDKLSSARDPPTQLTHAAMSQIHPQTCDTHYLGVSKNRGVSPKMDGENNGKPYSNGWFGGTTIFGHIHLAGGFFTNPFWTYAKVKLDHETPQNKGDK